MVCCDLNINELRKIEDDEEICQDCYDRIEAYAEDLELSRAKEEYYEWKYGIDKD